MIIKLKKNEIDKNIEKIKMIIKLIKILKKKQ